MRYFKKHFQLNCIHTHFLILINQDLEVLGEWVGNFHYIQQILEFSLPRVTFFLSSISQLGYAIPFKLIVCSTWSYNRKLGKQTNLGTSQRARMRYSQQFKILGPVSLSFNMSNDLIQQILMELFSSEERPPGYQGMCSVEQDKSLTFQLTLSQIILC